MNTVSATMARMLAAAKDIASQSGRGALHIFIEDGNCDDESLEYCLESDRLTDEERAFLKRMLAEVEENERHGAWALAQCRDLLDSPSPPPVVENRND